MYYMLKFTPITELNFKKLKLNPKNVRISHMGGTLSDTAMVTELLRQSPKILLDIRNNGLQEELILHPTENIVIEGNTRLACIIRLNQECKETEPPNKQLQKFAKPFIRCKRFNSGTSKNDMDIYLAQIHVAGKTKWPRSNRARLLYNMHDRQNIPVSAIAYAAQLSAPTVYREIKSYKYCKQYIEEHITNRDDPDILKKFYYFWEFTRKSLDGFRKDEQNIKKFMKWVRMGKFSNSKQIRDLHGVLENADFYKIFLDYNMDVAIEELYKTNPSFNDVLYKQVQILLDKFEKFSTNECYQINNDPLKCALLHKLELAVNKLLLKSKQS